MCEGIIGASMPGMIDITDVFEDIKDRFNDCPVIEEFFILDPNELLLHVLSDFGKELQAALEEFIEDSGEVAFIAEAFAPEAFEQRWQQAGIVIGYITRGNLESDQFSYLIDNQVYFQAKEPAHGGFAPLSDILEDLVRMNSMRIADRKFGRVDIINAAPFAQAHDFKHRPDRQAGSGDQFDKAIVARRIGKL